MNSEQPAPKPSRPLSRPAPSDLAERLHRVFQTAPPCGGSARQARGVALNVQSEVGVMSLFALNRIYFSNSRDNKSGSNSRRRIQNKDRGGRVKYSEYTSLEINL
mmetsp:Transcript_15971/g.28649  ORF Transcript_15971/g.28649 Transcript_15971/m.28649 type:complete len:105 (+) Transcript_15971:98-412(+)